MFKSLQLLLLILLSVLQKTKVIADTSVSASPDQIDVGLSSSLDVNCTVSLNGSAMVEIISLLVSRETSPGGNLTELATITDFSAPNVNLVSNEGIAADGFLDSGEKSYLHLHWDYPMEQQKGTYHCTAQGMDFLGHIVILNNVAVVSGSQPDIVDVMGKIREMERHFSDVDNYNKYLEQKMTDMYSHISDLEQRVTEMDSYTVELEKQNELLRQEMLDSHWTILELENITFEMPPLIYNESKYYISHTPFMEINKAIDICKAIGGFIAEIDDKVEHETILTYLNQTYLSFLFGAVYIGGTDEAKEGEWVLPSSNQPLPVTDWMTPTQPDNGDDFNCLALYMYLDAWRMASFRCQADVPLAPARFLCEIPSV